MKSILQLLESLICFWSPCESFLIVDLIESANYMGLVVDEFPLVIHDP
jgi:hypothetical protein